MTAPGGVTVSFSNVGRVLLIGAACVKAKAAAQINKILLNFILNIF